MPVAQRGEDGTRNFDPGTTTAKTLDLAGFLGGNPYYNTGAAGGSTTTTGGNTTTTTPNPPVVSGTGSSGITADMILNNPNFRPEDIDKLNFDQNGNLIIDTTGLQQLGIGPLTSLGTYGGGNQAIDYNKFIGGGTDVAPQPRDTVVPSSMLQQSPNVVPSSMLPSWVKPPPPGAIVTQAVTSVTNPETGETVQVPTGGYTYDPDYNKNPYAGLVGVNPPPPTPERQFNNLMNTVGRATTGDVQNTFKSPNPYVQQSGIATALPPRKI